jgi:hypothetical protein
MVEKGVKCWLVSAVLVAATINPSICVCVCVCVCRASLSHKSIPNPKGSRLKQQIASRRHEKLVNGKRERKKEIPRKQARQYFPSLLAICFLAFLLFLFPCRFLTSTVCLFVIVYNQVIKKHTTDRWKSNFFLLFPSSNIKRKYKALA